jgi:polyhydroxybutyrate depolymerase
MSFWGYRKIVNLGFSVFLFNFGLMTTAEAKEPRVYPQAARASGKTEYKIQKNQRFKSRARPTRNISTPKKRRPTRSSKRSLLVGSNSGMEIRQLTVGGLTRTYYLFTPSSYSASRPMPVVLGFHGGGSLPQRLALVTEFNTSAEQENFIVAYPTGIDQNWSDGRESKTLPNADDVAFTAAVISDLQITRNIDSQRIYATGYSNGGILTHRLACELSDKIAAFATVAANIATPIANTCQPGRPVPVLTINSPSDLIMPWTGGTLVKAGGGSIVSVPNMLTLWRNINGANSQQSLQPPGNNAINDGTSVSITRYTGTADRSEVIFVRIDGAGHTWPQGVQQPSRLGKTSQNLSATEYIWDFFKNQKL